MRSSKQRSRSKSNRPKTLGNIVNRVFDSSGPEGKVRGTPQQIIDKYLVLARDAQLSGDRIATENFLQHAEHYTRMLSEAQREMAREQEARREQHQQQNQNQNRRVDGREGGDQPGGGRDEAEAGSDQGGRDNGGRRPDGRDERGRDDRARDTRREDKARDDRDERRSDAPLAGPDEGDSMLVETPESRARNDAVDTPAERKSDAPAGDAPTAQGETSDDKPDETPGAEGASEGKRPRQPRARATTRRAPRKPKSDDPAPEPGDGNAAAAE